MYLKRSKTIKRVEAGMRVVAAEYCKWFMYFQQQYWTELDCSDNHDSTCTKILFAADSHIIGDFAYYHSMGNDLFSNERYLKTTFDAAVNYFKPDVLVYLGDLMDEGSSSTFTEFHSYVSRLSDIFKWTFPYVQVWIPGDTDIGGEDEPIYRAKVEEFATAFQQQSVTTFFNISIYTVSAITYTFPQKADEPPGTENNFKIVVSHYPITTRVMLSRKIMNAINPQIFFCAHDHESKYVKQHKNLTHKVTTWFNESKSMLNITFDDDSLYEIYVPTCSNRLGTSYIGYGAAVIENNHKNMRYTVFWSPTSIPDLYCNLGSLIVYLVCCLVFCAWLLYRKALKPSAKSACPHSWKEFSTPPSGPHKANLTLQFGCTY